MGSEMCIRDRAGEQQLVDDVRADEAIGAGDQDERAFGNGRHDLNVIDVGDLVKEEEEETN